MSGWEIACMIVGLLLVIDEEKLPGKFIGAFMVLIPLYFNMWRN